MEINLTVDGQISAEMVQIRDLGAYFEWDIE
jgi:hypothetical protein